jgi:hypothetical protein
MKILFSLLLCVSFSLPAVCQNARCTLQPTEVMVGEPIMATVITDNFNPKHVLNYNWTGSGGAVIGKDATAYVDTSNAAPGSYVITAHIMDPKAKRNNQASCSVSYTIKALPPKNSPTMTCTANPSAVMPGVSVTIACSCTSPDGVPTSVKQWAASNGAISGTGNVVTVDTSGAPSGSIIVDATCADARGLSAQATTAITVELPPPPPPQAAKMSQCDFANETKPWRVDNMCKAMLDDVALRLLQDPDAHLVIVGNASPSEKRPYLAAERAVDCKFYLTHGEAPQRIEAGRIEVRTGSSATRTAEFWVVPAGATLELGGTIPVDESKVPPVLDHPASTGRKRLNRP